MNNLPYIVPDEQIEINIGIIILLIEKVGRNRNGRLLLDRDKCMIFMYLVKSPKILNILLRESGKDEIDLDDDELLSVSILNKNIDPLFNQKRFTSVIIVLISEDLISIVNHNNNSLYDLTDRGKAVAQILSSTYFDKISNYISYLSPIKSKSSSNLRGGLKSF